MIELSLIKEKRSLLEKRRDELKDQIQKGQQSLGIIQQELQRMVQEHNNIQSKIELLDEIEIGGDEVKTEQ